MQKENGWQGDLYHKNSTLQFDTAQELLSTVEWQGIKAVLDVGCGSGAVTDSIAKRISGGCVYGIDASEDMIQKAEENYCTTTNLFFKQDSAEHFDFEDKRFDAITTFSCLHWIKDQKKVMEQVSEYLKKNGIFLAVLAYNDNQNYSPIIQMLIQIGLTEKWKKCMPEEFLNAKTREEFIMNQYYPHNEDSFKVLLEAAGLQSVELKKITKKIEFITRTDLINWILAWVVGLPFIKSLPLPLRSEFITEAINNIYSDNQKVEYESEWLLVHARK
jgi:trans-aconitate 2-methyltransferase